MIQFTLAIFSIVKAGSFPRSEGAWGAQRMTIERVSKYSNHNDAVAANSYNDEIWAGTLGEKNFTVHIDSRTAPRFSGDELDEYERDEVLAELADRSGL